MLQYLLHHFFREDKKTRTQRSRKYQKIKHVPASAETTYPFAEVEYKTLLFFVNVKQKKFDSSTKQVKIIGISVFNISCFP
jgi:hypothetical protein